MQRLFVSNEEFDHEFSRSRARGHKRVLISEDVETAKPVKMRTEGTDLVIEPDNEDSGDEAYIMLCKEFGLVNGGVGFKNKISVIFCDNGWMFVTLLHGALVMNLDDQLLMPSVGNDFQTPRVVKEDICWVNAENLLDYSKYLGIKGNFMYDIEFIFEVGGDNQHNIRNFSFKHIEEEDIDLSLGYIAQYEEHVKKHEETMKSRNIMKNIVNSGNNQSNMVFDEDEDDNSSTEDDSFDDDVSYEM